MDYLPTPIEAVSLFLFLKPCLLAGYFILKETFGS